MFNFTTDMFPIFLSMYVMDVFPAGICYGLKRLLARAHFRFVRLRRAPRVHNYDYRSDDYVRESFVPCPEDEDAERLRPLSEPEVWDWMKSYRADSLSTLPVLVNQGKLVEFLTMICVCCIHLCTLSTALK